MKAMLVRLIEEFEQWKGNEDVKNIEDVGKLTNRWNEVYNKLKDEGRERRILGALPDIMQQAYQAKMMGVGGFKIRTQALKGREVRRVQQDKEKKEEQDNAWTKIKRVATCTNRIGIAIKKALRKGDDLDHSAEGKQ